MYRLKALVTIDLDQVLEHMLKLKENVHEEVSIFRRVHFYRAAQRDSLVKLMRARNGLTPDAIKLDFKDKAKDLNFEKEVESFTTLNMIDPCDEFSLNDAICGIEEEFI
jgi:hypothetical protein